MVKINKARFEKATESLKNTKILVIGDLILDEYLFGQVERISPEAPVPVVWVRREEITLGGAGNVVKNLHTLGTPISVIGRAGKDKNSKLLRNLLENESVKPEDLILFESENTPTIIKTRILAGHQQVCRVDREEKNPLSSEEEEILLKAFRRHIQSVSGVILSDYDKGLLTGSFIEKIIHESIEEGKIVTVDPQVNHFFRYKGVSILTPNHHEAGKSLGRTLNTENEIEDALREINQKLRPEAIMITRGEKGMSVYESKSKSITHIPTVARQVFDVTGAGDTVITVYTAFLGAGLSVIESAIVSNAAAGVVVAKLGAATASIEEIQSRLEEIEMWEES
jgi:rfaE bifunctional protein kinase chain/domain